MARAALHWTRARLAHEAGVGAATVQRFESGQVVLDASIAAIDAALVKAGVLLIAAGAAAPAGGIGVRLAAH